jgi:GntR family transcriptional regulator, transcriptional repressor for pyruvate dehydrogenase complex
MKDQAHVKCVTGIFARIKKKTLAFKLKIGMMVVPVEKAFEQKLILPLITVCKENDHPCGSKNLSAAGWRQEKTMTPALAPVEKRKASEQVAEMLLKYILQGGVRPGEMLPAERTLATQLNVTRATLREALKKLEQLKLVTIHQGKGIIVEDFRNASIDLIFSLLVINGEIDLKILENIMEARQLFGSDVARLAAGRADNKDIEQMKSLMEKMAATKEPAESQQLDFEFFHLLAQASKNMVYILLMNTIKTIHDRNLDIFLPLSSHQNISLKQEILQAVINGEEEKAAEKANAFLQTGMTLLKGVKQ